MSDQLNRPARTRRGLALVLRLDAWLAAFATALILCAPGDASPADPTSDPDSVPIWMTVRQSLFGVRPISKDAGEVIALRVPARSQDASVVPVSISTRLPQTPQRHISRIWVIIDQNPSRSPTRAGRS